jgi:hypothetical protein
MSRRCVYFLLALCLGGFQYWLFAQDATTQASPHYEQERTLQDKDIKERNYNIYTGFTFRQNRWNIGMTKEQLAEAGFTEEHMLDYRREEHEEWMTFYDWSSPHEEIITFYFVDGKLQRWMSPPAKPEEN